MTKNNCKMQLFVGFFELATKINMVYDFVQVFSVYMKNSI